MDWPALANRMQRSLLGSLAEPVEVRPDPGGPSPAPDAVTLRGIYERPPVETQGEGGVDYRGAEHRVTCATTDLPAWADRGALVVVRGFELAIVERWPDGQGLVSLSCRRAP